MEKNKVKPTSVKSENPGTNKTVKKDIIVCARKKNFFGCTSDTQIEDIAINDDSISFVMGNISKTIEMDDLISISSAPQSLQDQNCLSVFFKEYTDSKKTNFKISEFKLVVTRSISKNILIEKLRLNIRKKFDFSHLQSTNEISSKDYFKGLINKPQQVYQGVKIIFFVYFFKNTIHFFNIIKKKFGNEKSLLGNQIENNAKKPELNNQGHNIIKFGKIEDDFINDDAQNFNINKDNRQKDQEIHLKRGINDSNLFNNEEIESNPHKIINNDSRIQIFEQKDSSENQNQLIPNDINFEIDADNYKEELDNDFKKIVLQNKKNNDEYNHLPNKFELYYSNNYADRPEKHKDNVDENKDIISFKKKDSIQKSIKDFETFYVNTNIKDENKRNSNKFGNLEMEQINTQPKNINIRDEINNIDDEGNNNENKSLNINKERIKLYQD